MTPLITPVRAWLARAGVESRIEQILNNQVRVTWERKEKQTMNSITKLTFEKCWREMSAVYGLINNTR
jgi:hypothetical protein